MPGTGLSIANKGVKETNEAPALLDLPFIWGSTEIDLQIYLSGIDGLRRKEKQVRRSECAERNSFFFLFFFYCGKMSIT